MHLTRNRKRYRGLSTLDVVAIIAVILLVGAGFFTFSAVWKKGSDRAGCILQIRFMQQAVRSCQGVDGYYYYSQNKSKGVIPVDEIIGSGKYLEVRPVCPAGGSYDLPASGGGIRVPDIGGQVMHCSLEGSHDHKPDDVSGW